MRRWFAGVAVLSGSLAYATGLSSGGYLLSFPGFMNGSANTASTTYQVRTGTIGQGLFGSSVSDHYRNSIGLNSPDPVTFDPLATTLVDAYVYPNPFKPNSPGIFQADKITFKHLPAEATLRIFAITGSLVVELHKTDRTVDHFEWDTKNSDGRKLGSGVYIYYLTAPGSRRAKGKFAIIR